MGGGRFSYEAYQSLRVSKSYGSKSRSEIFTSTSVPPDMDPRGVKMRESRDSEEHPESLSIIVGLDVTGSMGMVPEDIVKNTLPDLVGTLIEAGIEHPQVCFIALGDFIYDSAPLQIGQFESSAELLDRWLTRVYLEGGGGGNGKESYNLAYLFAGRHTSIDCFEKRKQKGFLFTIGDEQCNENIPGDIITRLTPAEEAATISTEDMLEEAQRKYHVYHMHVEHNDITRMEVRRAGWSELLGEGLIIVPDYKRIAKTIAKTVIAQVKSDGGVSGSNGGQLNGKSESVLDDIQVEDML